MPNCRKVLYEKSLREDNEIDETFLQSVRTNEDVRTYSLAQLVRCGLSIAQHLASVLIFISLFLHSLSDSLSLDALMLLVAIIPVVGFALRIISDPSPSSFIASSLSPSLFTVFFFLIVYGISPVLRTLTVSFSDDTVWALTSIFLLLNVFFFDYAHAGSSSPRRRETFSLNGAMFASMLIASRMPSDLHTFAIVTLAVENFALRPRLQYHLKTRHSHLEVCLSLLFCVAAVALFFDISLFVAAASLGVFVFVAVGCPLCLLYLQRFKRRIRGPWDEASISND
mmetsp:Transcript_19512/g.33497  ORF Transcript_19512/g.33497 Transcript_19512/m.33497 type:complete len:283 (-) Transcript_19512:304-1152(-)